MIKKNLILWYIDLFWNVIDIKYLQWYRWPSTNKYVITCVVNVKVKKYIVYFRSIFHYRLLIYKIRVLRTSNILSSCYIFAMWWDWIFFIFFWKFLIWNFLYYFSTLSQNLYAFTVCPTMYRFPCINVYTHPSLYKNVYSTLIIRRTYVTPEN